MDAYMKPIRESMKNTLKGMRKKSIGSFMETKKSTKKTLKVCSLY